MGSSPVTLRRLRGAVFSRRRVRWGHHSDLRRLAAGLAVVVGLCAGPACAGSWSPAGPPTKEVYTEGPKISPPPARGKRWGLLKKKPDGKEKQAPPISGPKLDLNGQGQAFLQRIMDSSFVGPQQRPLAGAAPSFGAHGTSFLAGTPCTAPRRGTGQARLQASRTQIFSI